MNPSEFLKQLSFDFQDMKVVKVQSSLSSVVNLIVKKGDFEFKASFDSEKQIYEFGLFQGGQKTFTTYADFKKYFGAYIYVNTVVIPNDKIIADKFEKQQGINTIYELFRGNVDSGFITKFRVLGKEDTVIIGQENDVYIAQLQDGDGKILAETRYKQQGDDFVEFLCVDTFVNKLYEKYKDDDNISIRRIDTNLFTIQDEDVEFNFSVFFEEDDVVFKVTSAAGKSHVIRIEDYLDMHLITTRIIDAEEQDSQKIDSEKEEELMPVVENDEDIVGAPPTDDMFETEQVVEQEPTQEEEVVEEAPVVEKKPTKKSKGKSVSTESTSHADDYFFLIHEQDESSEDGIADEVIAVGYISGTEIFTMNREIADSFKFPYNRIRSYDVFKRHHGVEMLDCEAQNRVFAEDISGDLTRCEELIFKMFE